MIEIKEERNVNLEVYETNDIVHTFTIQDKPVKQVSTSCNCTNYHVDGNNLILKAKTELVEHVVPKRMLEEGKNTYQKYIKATVKYQDNTEEDYQINATIRQYEPN